MSADQLRAFLSHPHGAMPNLALTRAEMDDLIGYIETLTSLWWRDSRRSPASHHHDDAAIAQRLIAAAIGW
jgi:hypothetical protein